MKLSLHRKGCSKTAYDEREWFINLLKGQWKKSFCILVSTENQLWMNSVEVTKVTVLIARDSWV
ncbi:CLUMA_CG004065, isoform A [Clunio marinus]|uniref:CLUMA_CG004065, isoform A n=1 Tax=Clunio marinus TaxID=568069 RepID=A0A1J1HVZ3_9DIPT|nr:CLUMA_CG004065, isoform A [Clunio marinus]